MKKWMKKMAIIGAILFVGGIGVTSIGAAIGGAAAGLDFLIDQEKNFQDKYNWGDSEEIWDDTEQLPEEIEFSRKWTYSEYTRWKGVFFMDENKVDFEKMTPAERLKYEVAEEIGLADKVRQYGWRSLTAKESGRIGGLMTKKRREMKQNKKG